MALVAVTVLAVHSHHHAAAPQTPACTPCPAVRQVLLLGCLRKVAKRTVASVETAALAVVLTDNLISPRLGPPSRERAALLRAARFVFLPALVIKSVRLARRCLVGKRPDRKSVV